MQLFVKSLSGRTLAVSAQPGWAAGDVLAAACAAEGLMAVPAGVQLATAMGVLCASECLAAQGVMADSTVYALAPVDGGKKKKKKKKIFKNAKKKAHKHKNIKMRVLKYYKVEGDGEGAEYKVTHERTECPHPDCGAGVFMAAHKDRQTCGKCSLTYVFQKK